MESVTDLSHDGNKDVAPKNAKLTVEKAGSGIRYRKQYKGKTWTSQVFRLDSRRNKAAAWDRFVAWRDQQVPERTPRQALADDWGNVFDRAAEYYQLVGQRTLAAQQLEAAARVKEAAELDDETFTAVTGLLTEGFARERDRWAERLALVDRQQAVERPDSVDANVEDFLKQKRASAAAGQLSAGRVEVLRIALIRFGEWFGPKRSVSDITGERLIQYREHLETLPHSAIYRRDGMAAVRQWVGWLWATDRIETLPRVMGGAMRTLSVRVSPKKIRTLPLDQVQPLFESASGKTQLYMLLALNAGMTQVDIAELLREEVDLELGRITRKRSKTGHHASAPEVSYLLWPMTLKLLREHMSERGPLALLNEEGGPLRVEALVEEKTKKVCNITSAWGRVRAKFRAKGVEIPSFKVLRKTGVTALVSNPAYVQFEHQYLGESEKTIAARHYAERSAKLFDEALTWLGGHLGFVTPGENRDDANPLGTGGRAVPVAAERAVAR